MLKTSYEPRGFQMSTQIKDKTVPKLGSHRKIMQLFTPAERQIFQLDYLQSSSHASTYPEYIEILSILSNYNTTSNEILEKGTVDLNSTENIITKYCMKFLYKEMLSISVMNEKQIQNNNYALKLKNWYLSLNDKRNFFDGINLSKAHFFNQDIEEMIRKSYVSNVYDEIGDYLRKKICYLDNNYKQTGQDQQKVMRQTTPAINLPLIDTQLYNRQLGMLKRQRQKRFDRQYIEDIKRHKNKVRQIQMQNIKHSQFRIQKLIKKRTILSRPQQQESQATIKAKRLNSNGYKNTTLYGIRLSMLDYRNSENMNVPLTNVNGINLINSKSVYIGSGNGQNTNHAL